MQILLLGATGRTGRSVLGEALGRGHHVTALVRSPDALADLELPSRDKMLVVQGSPVRAGDVEKAVASASASASASSTDPPPLVVISTLNPRRTSDSPFAALHPTDSPPRMMADSIRNVVEALRKSSDRNQESDGEGKEGEEGKGAGRGGKNKKKKKPKVVALSALGAGSSSRSTHWLLGLLFRRSKMRYTLEDHEAVEEELRGPTQHGAGAVGAVGSVLVRPTRLVEGAEGRARVFNIENGGVVGLTETVSRGAVARFLVDAAEGDEWDGKAPIIVG